MNEERILVVVPRLNLDDVTRTVGDLIFTTRHVFLTRTIGNAGLAQAFDRIEAAAAKKRAERVSQELRAPLDTILAAADRRTRFEYRELQSITVELGGLFSSPAVRLIPRHGNRLRLSGQRAALKRLASAIPFLVDAGVPISL